MFLPRWKVLTMIAAGIAAMLGVITAAHTAWPIMDPFMLAHRGYVVEKVGGVQTTTNELLLWKFEDSKNKIAADIGGWTIQMQKEQDQQTRRLIEQRIQQLGADQQQIDDRIRKLKGN